MLVEEGVVVVLVVAFFEGRDLFWCGTKQVTRVVMIAMIRLHIFFLCSFCLFVFLIGFFLT